MTALLRLIEAGICFWCTAPAIGYVNRKPACNYHFYAKGGGQ